MGEGRGEKMSKEKKRMRYMRPKYLDETHTFAWTLTTPSADKLDIFLC